MRWMDGWYVLAGWLDGASEVSATGECCAGRRRLSLLAPRSRSGLLSLLFYLPLVSLFTPLLCASFAQRLANLSFFFLCFLSSHSPLDPPSTRRSRRTCYMQQYKST